MGEALSAVLPGKGRIGSLATPSSDSRFFCLLHWNMDKIFVDEALQAYRDSTGDMRPWQLLPVAVTSQILLDAQRRKSFRRRKFSQPTAAEGCVGS
jgi:hypothetical protein